MIVTETDIVFDDNDLLKLQYIAVRQIQKYLTLRYESINNRKLSITEASVIRSQYSNIHSFAQFVVDQINSTRELRYDDLIQYLTENYKKEASIENFNGLMMYNFLKEFHIDEAMPYKESPFMTHRVALSER